MNLKNSIGVIIRDIQEIETIVTNFENYSIIPEIEMDLTLSKVRNLYDILLLLNKANSEFLKDQEKTLRTDSSKIEIVKKIPFEKPPSYEKISQIDDEQKQSFPQIKDQPSEVKKPSPETIKETPMKEKPTSKTDPEILADKFQKPKYYVNEALTKTKNQQDISTKLQSKPILDISSAIGLNDKFLFTKELFDGNNEKYIQTIDTLNTSVNFNEAVSYIKENFDWDMDNPVVEKLLDLLKRKFITGNNE